MPSEHAGDFLHNAKDIDIASGVASFKGSIGLDNDSDYYRISIKSSSNIDLKLEELSADASIKLLDSGGEIITNGNSNDFTKEYLSRFLTEGEYYIQIYSEDTVATDYKFHVTTVPLDTKDFAGNSIKDAKEVQILSDNQTYTDGVGSGDIFDYYKFNLSDRAHFKLSLQDLSANANVRLLDDSGSTILTSIHDGINDESISRVLDKGEYYIRVYAYGEVFTNYNLSLTGNPTANSTLSETSNQYQNQTQKNFESPVFSDSGTISPNNSEDIYTFKVEESGIFTANLNNLTGDGDIRLIQDVNANNVIDKGEVIAWQPETGTVKESIRSFLESGTYSLQISSYDNQLTNYSLDTDFSITDRDNRSFSIQVNFDEGSEFLTEPMKNAAIEAAQVWENIVTHSTFKGSHTVKIDVGGSNQGWDSRILASAGPKRVSKDESDNWMPVAGSAHINTDSNAIKSLSSDIDYFRNIMVHEFGHVLGLGNFWGELKTINGDNIGRNLVDKESATYDSDTYAGFVYGEMLGTSVPTEIPVTKGISFGSDFTHWDEGTFDTELMTHEADREEMPLSKLTIAALRDLGWNVNYGAAEDYFL